ncbi:MAG: response regulator [Limisphaerales bacterium]
MPALPILLVEDIELNRDMLIRRLERRGSRITLAMDGAEGIAKAGECQPHLILTDFSLPIVDGWEAIRSLNGAPETATIPIIALTAHALAEDEKNAREAGADVLDTKPVELHRILQELEALLGRTV